MFLLRLSKVKVKGIYDGPLHIIFAFNCSLLMTCLFTNLVLNFNCNSFYHISRGFRVPDVSMIDFGENFLIYSNVNQGTKHLRPNVNI